MDETNLEDKLNELVKEFGETATPLINSLQESLDYLRVCIKYQVFDLEATRRENEYLRKLLEENNS